MSVHRMSSALLALTLSVAPMSVLAAPYAWAADQTATGATATQAVAPGLYIVTLDAPPAAAYDGGRAGYPATRADAGARFDSRRPSVQRYRALLRAGQDRVLTRIGEPPLLYRYTTALNGFAATLTTAQVKQLRDMADVVSVEHNTFDHLETVDTPTFMELTGPSGVWARHGGPSRAGAGVVVGVVDSGIWPDNPSFTDLPAASATDELAGFTGSCEPGEDWQAGDCNNKIVAARYFVEGFGAHNLAESDYLSPRDGRGHGSHTASVIGGNHGVDVQIEDERIGTISGIAPVSRLAVYKACWTAPDPADDGCATVDTVKAVDQAVADGVSVLNYSISGSSAGLTQAVQEAFRHAAASGVFVVAPAGNTGPDAQTVAHPSPWVTTVGAATHQQHSGAAVLGDGTRLVGAMASDRPVRDARVVLAEEVPAPGSGRTAARRCQPGSLDARAVTGAVVVCERGVNPRLAKSTAVELAGGVGMILANTTPGSRNADFHTVPTVHIEVADGRQVRAYVADAGADATVSLDPTVSAGTTVPRIAGFSARGPSSAAGGSLLKPDVTAPGVGVLAAVAPPTNDGRRWDGYSGTSVATPQVAGLGALIRAEHPEWSPAAVKSALMTTAYDLDGNHRPFTQGSGHVDATRMLDPGLVYDSGPADWRGLLAASTRARDLNLASIAVGALTGRATVERTVTNVSGGTETYTASVSGLPGVGVDVLPASTTLAPGESQTFRVRLVAKASAEYGEFTRGWLTWDGSRGHTVRSPVVVRPRTVQAPAEVHGREDAGSVSVQARSGLIGDLDLTTHGMVGSTPQPLTLAPEPINPAEPAAGPGSRVSTFVVPEGTVAARFDLTAARSDDDLDLYVYRDGELVAAAASSADDERITLDAPEPGVYRVYANAYSAADGVSVDGTFTSWVVPDEDLGNLTVAPNPVGSEPAEPLEVTASWSGLDPKLSWFGVIGYESSDALTHVSVD